MTESGTEPDSWTFKALEYIRGKSVRDIMDEVNAAYPDAKWWRITSVADGIWIEIWNARPLKEAPFRVRAL